MGKNVIITKAYKIFNALANQLKTSCRMKMFVITALTLLYLAEDACSQSFDVLDAIYCDLSTMKYLFLKPGTNDAPSKSNIDVAILRSKTIKVLELKSNSSSQNDFAAKEFNDITKSLHNISKTSNSDINNDDYDDSFFEDDDFVDLSQRTNNDTRRNFWYDEFTNNTAVDQAVERKKIKRVIKIHLQYIVHTRRKIEEALELRRTSTIDKRYKLGYLFNRLRRLNTEQLKVVTTASLHKKSPYFDLKTLLRIYENVVRFDVDIKDTINVLKALFVQPAPFDFEPLE